MYVHIKKKETVQLRVIIYITAWSRVLPEKLIVA
jgi:hypothetical protein